MNETGDRTRLTIRELGWWTGALCIAWASPGWIGEHGSWLSFYGMLVFATWRLSKYIPLGCAFAISFGIALLVTLVTIWIINQ